MRSTETLTFTFLLFTHFAGRSLLQLSQLYGPVSVAQPLVTGQDRISFYLPTQRDVSVSAIYSVASYRQTVCFLETL